MNGMRLQKKTFAQDEMLAWGLMKPTLSYKKMCIDEIVGQRIKGLDG